MISFLLENGDARVSIPASAILAGQVPPEVLQQMISAIRAVGIDVAGPTGIAELMRREHPEIVEAGYPERPRGVPWWLHYKGPVAECEAINGHPSVILFVGPDAYLWHPEK